jgi:tetratricopeptide (TPR) repeat protein
MARGDIDAAGSLCSRVAEGLADGLGEAHVETRVSRLNLAQIYMLQQRPEEAARLYRRVVEVQTLEPCNEGCGVCVFACQSYFKLAECLAVLNRPAEALPHYRKSAEMWALRDGSTETSAVLMAQTGIANCLYHLGRCEEALELLPRLCTYDMGQRGPGLVLLTIGALEAAGRVSEAVALAERELPRAQAALGPHARLTQFIKRILAKHASRSGAAEHGRGAGAPAHRRT